MFMNIQACCVYSISLFYTQFSELTSVRMEELREDFYKDDKNRLAQNVVSRSDPLETCMSRITIESNHHVFNHKVDEVKPVTRYDFT